MAVSFSAVSALAETRTVGSGKQHATLAEALLAVNPGDVVEVYEDQTYSASEDGPWIKRHGEPNAKIAIRGMKEALGRRPRLSGGNQWALFFNGNHFVFEGFEVTGGQQTCITLRANDVSIRDVVVHDCPRHGILGLDEGMGSLTMEYVEVYKCGGERSGEALKHPVYVSSDSNPATGYPKSVFRMEHCFIHDANDGNNVKTRAERNEIRYNWVEGAGYYELELIGPDLANDPAREDSEVIGNVFFKTNARSHVVRIGGDGTMDTNGRYRFVNNTFILAASAEGLLRANDGIESLEFSNNVAYRFGRSIPSVFRTVDAKWTQGEPRVSGANNWFPVGSEAVPAEFTGTIFGDDPGFTSTSPLDLRPAANSPLVDKGTESSPSAPNAPFPNPFLGPPEFVPAQRALSPAGSPIKRPRVGAPDIGAYEAGSDAPSAKAGPETNMPPPTANDGDASGPSSTRDACGCRAAGANGAPLVAPFGIAFAFVFVLRGRRHAGEGRLPPRPASTGHGREV